MLKVVTIGRIKYLSARVVAQIGAVIAMAACTLVGYQLHALTSDSRFVATFWRTYRDVTGTVASFFDMDPIVATIFYPAVIVGVLILGGLYLWRQGDG